MPTRQKVDDVAAFFARPRNHKENLFKCLSDGGIWNFKPGVDSKPGTDYRNILSRAKAWMKDNVPNHGLNWRKEADGSVSLQIFEMNAEQLEARERLRAEAKIRLNKASQ